MSFFSLSIARFIASVAGGFSLNILDNAPKVASVSAETTGSGWEPVVWDFDVVISLTTQDDTAMQQVNSIQQERRFILIEGATERRLTTPKLQRLVRPWLIFFASHFRSPCLLQRLVGVSVA